MARLMLAITVRLVCWVFFSLTFLTRFQFVRSRVLFVAFIIPYFPLIVLICPLNARHIIIVVFLY